jgi:fumarate reductase subunit D
MSDAGSLISDSLRIINRHKRYIFWFWLLNLTLSQFGVASFRNQVHSTLDRSLLSNRLVNGFDLSVFVELLTRPQTGSLVASIMPVMYFAILFYVATLLLMPGVLEGYTSEARLSREEFLRSCGRNLWRFVRLLLYFALIAGPIVGVLFGIKNALMKAADNSTNELTTFYTSLITSLVIFLVMTMIRIWFDLAQVDVVVRDQRAVRRSAAAGFRLMRRHCWQLLGTYLLIAVVAVVVFVLGFWVWHALRPNNVLGAFCVSQLMLVFWLLSRFWQRASAAAHYLREMEVTGPAVVIPEPSPSLESNVPIAPPGPEGITSA